MDQSNNDKIVGVAVDNYKVNKFKKTFLKKGFDIIDVVKLNKDVQVIRIQCPSEKFLKLGKLIKSLEVLFKRRN